MKKKEKSFAGEKKRREQIKKDKNLWNGGNIQMDIFFFFLPFLFT